MFMHNINPVLVSIGALEIRYYSLAYILGFLLAYWLLWKAADKKLIENLTKKGVDDLVVYLILGVIIGGRLFHFVFYNPSAFWTNPLEILYIWHGGMAFHGGLIGVLFAYWLFMRKHKVKFYPVADLVVLPLAIALCLGRIANFINGELWGTMTNSNFCIDYSQNQYMSHTPEGCRHPSQLYESVKNLAIFFILLFMYKKEKVKDGVVFWSFILLYGVLRFIVNFWRDDIGEHLYILGISTGQYLSLIMAIIAVVFLVRLKNKK